MTQNAAFFSGFVGGLAWGAIIVGVWWGCRLRFAAQNGKSLRHRGRIYFVAEPALEQARKIEQHMWDTRHERVPMRVELR